ncbi:MAG TPA: zf-HC2 domain-containing protein, partial [Streptosporangiaceae bacterium]
GADLADALGVPANQAHALASRARGQLERSLGALLVARTGREQCAELDQILGAWDGELTPLLRKRVSRHIENCEACGARKRRELSPAALFSVLPVAILPPGLRHQVLRLVSDVSADAASYRVQVSSRAEPFGPSGFPVQLSPMRPSGRGNRRLRFQLLAAAAALLLLCGGAAFVLLGYWPGRAGDVAAASKVVVTTQPGSTASVGSAPAPASSSPATRTPATTAPASPAPSGSVTAPASSSPSPSPSRTRTATPTPTPTPTPGTLSASPTYVRMTQPAAGGPYSGSFVLTASGGPVKFTVSLPTGTNGLAYFAASPAGGTLKAGQSVTVVVTAINGGPPQAYNTVTVNPGAVQVTMFYPPAS